MLVSHRLHGLPDTMAVRSLQLFILALMGVELRKFRGCTWAGWHLGGDAGSPVQGAVLLGPFGPLDVGLGPLVAHHLCQIANEGKCWWPRQS